MIVSRIKTGFDTLEDLKLPISADYSIAGYVAATARLINIHDVYDVEELKSHEPPVYFFRAVDKSAGYRTKQVLAAPIFGSVDSSEVKGVAQLVNTLSGKPFPKAAEEGLEQLCKALTVAFRHGEKSKRAAVQTKYDHLVIDGVITAGEKYGGTASSSARIRWLSWAEPRARNRSGSERAGPSWALPQPRLDV